MSYEGRKSSASGPAPPSPIPPPATVSMAPPPPAAPVVAWAVVDACAAPVGVPQVAATDSALQGPVGSAFASAADVCVWTVLAGSQEPDTPGRSSADAAGRDP